MFKRNVEIIFCLFFLIFNQMVVADTSYCRTDIDKMVQSINLDDNQRTKIKPIVDQLKSDLKSASSKIGPIDTQIKQLVNSKKVDLNQVNSLIDQKAKLIGDMMKSRLAAQNQIIRILNPQQRDKLQGLLNQEDEKMAEIYSKCYQD